MQTWAKNRMKGATFKEITLGTPGETPVLLPVMKLQKEFSEIAEKIEQLRVYQEQSKLEIDNCLME